MSAKKSTKTLDELLSLVRFDKNTLAKIDRRIKKYQRIEKNTIDAISEKNKLLDRILKYSKEISSEPLKKEINLKINDERKKNAELLKKREKIFGNELYNKLKEKDMIIEGRSPEFKVSFFHLEMDSSKNRCKIYYGPKEEFIDNLPLDSDKISEFLESYLNNLEKNTVSPSILVQSYHELMEDNKGLLKRRVPIIKLLLRVALNNQNGKFLSNPVDKLFDSYGRIQFSYDLYKLRRENKLPIRLHSASRIQVRDRQEYLWVPTNENDGSVFSAIEILED